MKILKTVILMKFSYSKNFFSNKIIYFKKSFILRIGISVHMDPEQNLTFINYDRVY